MMDIQTQPPAKTGRHFWALRLALVVLAVLVLIWQALSAMYLVESPLKLFSSSGGLLMAGTIAGIGLTIATQLVVADIQYWLEGRRQDAQHSALIAQLRERASALETRQNRQSSN